MMKTHKSFVAVIGVAFVLGSAVAFADDKTPSTYTPDEQAKAKAERDAARAARAKMTPEEKKAAKEARKRQKQKEVSQDISVGNIPSGPQKADAITKNAQATKSDPKPLPDAKSKQEALKQQTNKPTGQ